MNGPSGQPKVLVAIPAYNCEKQIVRVLNDFDDALLARLWKVMVIDNPQQESTRAFLGRFKASAGTPEPAAAVIA